MMPRRYCTGALLLAAVVLSVAAAGRGEAPLVEAVREGNAKAVVALLQRKVDVNAPTADGTTALHWAVHRNDAATVDRLIRAGANVNVANRFGMAPLSMAAENGNAAILERLLKAGADPNATLPGGETALMTASEAGSVEAVRLLLAHHANVNAREKTRDQTPLMWAAAEGHTAVVKALIEAGADVNARSSELKAFHENTFVAGRKDADASEHLPMFTPFMFAALGGHIDVARLLLDAGANVNDATPNGTSALHVAVINAHWELAVLLLDRGANAKVESPGGTALHHIARARSTKVLVKTGGLPPPEPSGTMTSMDVVRSLVAHGADVNARMTKPLSATYGARQGSQSGMTPLMMTAIPADPEYMRELLAAGADPKLVTNNRTTLLQMAAGLGLTSLLGDDEEALTNVKMLVERGLDVNAQNDDGDTALHGAAFRDSVPVLQYLVDHGAQLDAKNKIGWTPLMEAHWTGRGNLVTRPQAEAFLRKAYEARGLPQIVSTRDEAIDKLYYSKGGPVISCPPGATVQSTGGKPIVIDYPEATAVARGRRYGTLRTQCSPGSGSEFPVGLTTVTCTATDDNNRSDSCTVLMRVVP